MTLLNDQQIIECNFKMAGASGHQMIHPFCSAQVRTKDDKKIISYGLSSFGYDIRLHNLIGVPVKHPIPAIIDPKYLVEDGESLVNQKWESIEIEDYTIPPHGFILASSAELFHMPDDVIAICVGKSTYARCGLVVNVTPLEPGWSGYLTLELSNTTDSAIKIYAGEGIAQLLFFKGERPSVTYGDRRGKYQNQPNHFVSAIV